MKRALAFAALVFVLAGCDVEWLPEFGTPQQSCDTVQHVEVTVGNAYETTWNPEEHDLKVISLRRRVGGGAWTNLISTPIFVDVPDDPTGDPEADGVNWLAYVDTFAYSSTATWTYELVWAWTDTGTTSPAYHQLSTTQNYTLPGCP